MTLGDRMDSLHDNRLPLTKRHMSLVTLFAFGGLLLFNALAYAITSVFYLSDNKIYEAHFNDHLESRKNPYPDIIQRTVPKIQDWYESYIEAGGLVNLPERSFQPPLVQHKQCLSDWFDFLVNSTRPTTDPNTILSIVTEMGIGNVPMIKHYLHDYLTEPIPLENLLQQSRSCLSSESRTITAMACSLQDFFENMPSSANQTLQDALDFTMNLAAILERLTVSLQEDVATLHQVADYMLDTPVRGGNFVSDFSQDKYNGIASSLKYYAVSSATRNELSLRVNILEAVLVDIGLGSYTNALLGLDLAVSSFVGQSIRQNRLEWGLGKAWVDAYLGWNANFVAGQLALENWVKLFIPSVSCTLQSPAAETFLFARVIALAHSLLVDRTRVSRPKLNLQKMMSSIFDSTVAIPRASPTKIRSMLAEMCQGDDCRAKNGWAAETFFVSNLDDKEFQVFYGFINWFTVLFAGYGLEILVLFGFLRKGWSTKLEQNWKLAQFVFPWLATVTLGLASYHNYMALLTLVPGLWKFGFSEVIGHIHCGLFGPFGPLRRFIIPKRAAELANGIGTIVHHGAASLLIVMLLAGVISPTREIITPILFLVMQHWFVLLVHVHRGLYIFLELSLEVLFQWAIFSGLPPMVADHWTADVCALTMAFAHYLYLFAAGTELCVNNWHSPILPKTLKKDGLPESLAARNKYETVEL